MRPGSFSFSFLFFVVSFGLANFGEIGGVFLLGSFFVGLLVNFGILFTPCFAFFFFLNLSFLRFFIP